MEVTATFVETTTDVESTESDFSIKTADISGYDRFKRGAQTATVKVNNASLAIPVTVSPPPLSAANILVNYREGVTNQDTYIKPVHIKGKDFDFNRSRIKVTLKLDGGVKVVLSAEDGLLPDEIQGFDKNTAGAQALSVKLENNTDKDIQFVVNVVDVEPAVWFDYGYMRHEGDPEGKGPGAGKYYAQPKEKLALAPVRFLIGYEDDPAIPYSSTICNRDIGADYVWQVVSGGSDYELTPSPATRLPAGASRGWSGSRRTGTATTYRMKCGTNP